MCAVGLRVCSQPMGWSAGLDVLLPMLSTQTGIDVIALMTDSSTIVFRTNLADVVQAPSLDWPHLRRCTRAHPALHQRVNIHQDEFRLPVWKKWPGWPVLEVSLPLLGWGGTVARLEEPTMPDTIRINRAPVLTLWGTVVTERLGFDRADRPDAWAGRSWPQRLRQGRVARYNRALA